MSQAAGFPEDVDVAVISHNGRQTLPRVLECLRACGAPADRITLYDIASTDDTLSWIAREWPNVRVERFERNDGPNLARNRALERARRPHVLLVDSDGFLRPGSVSALRDALTAGTGVGMTVPVVVHSDRPAVIQYAGASLHYICEAINPWSGRLLSERGTASADIGTAPGVAMLVDVAAAKKVGRFDARYFMGKEDGEFCYRLRIGGYRIVEVPAAVVAHGSRPRSTWLYRYQIRNRWHFILKNYRLWTILILLPVLLVHEMLQLLILLFHGEFSAWRLAMRGLWRWLPTLRRERKAIRAFRTTSDKKVLGCAPLVVRTDVGGGAAGRVFKKAYDAWLWVYWQIARLLIA